MYCLFGYYNALLKKLAQLYVLTMPVLIENLHEDSLVLTYNSLQVAMRFQSSPNELKPQTPHWEPSAGPGTETGIILDPVLKTLII